jgi:iron complex transport system permease protein
MAPHVALLGLAVLLFALILVAVGAGAFAISPLQAIAILLHALGISIPVEFSTQQQAVLITIRLPRVALWILAGAGLAVTGAALQGLFRNPLADPGLVGVSGGAALGAASVIVMGALWFPGLTQALGNLTLPLAAFLGGLLATLTVYRLASYQGRSQLAVMLLAGIAVNALAFAGIGLFSYLSTDEQLRNLTFWNLGSLGGAQWSLLLTIAPIVIVGIILLLRRANQLNALLLGEVEAGHLGIDIQRLKYHVIILTALVVGVLVAVSGIIGFVGLVVPHLLRLACGPDHKWVLPGAALLGAALMLAADVAARTVVIPAELPIGILTAFIGGPFFLWLLLRQRNQGSY